MSLSYCRVRGRGRARVRARAGVGVGVRVRVTLMSGISSKDEVWPQYLAGDIGEI